VDQFIAAYKDAIANNYANFSGRLGVGGYWRFVAVNLVPILLLLILSRVSGFFLILYILYVLAVLIPGLAAGIRRLHDTGKSGWYILISLIPFVGAIILIVWTVQAGNPGSNQYGPPPAS